MNVINTEAYRRAFAQYIRTGVPIRLSLKNDRPTRHYVWRTRGDERVRAEHHGSYLSVWGEIQFQFSDVFTDPSDARGVLAWIRRRPGEARELLNDLVEWVRFDAADGYEPEDIDPDDVAAWSFRLTEFGGIAYPITDAWRSEFRAEFVK